MIIEVNSFSVISELHFDTSIVSFDFESNPYRKYILYVNDDVTLGFLCYEDIFDRYEIDNIFVDLSNRRKGIGKKLIERLIELGKLSKIKNITLEVNKNNIPAIKLYEMMGFQERAIRKNYYNGVDGILMEKEMI